MNSSINIDCGHGSDDPSLPLLDPTVGISAKPYDQPQHDEEENDPTIHDISCRLREDFRRHTLVWKSRYQFFAQRLDTITVNSFVHETETRL